jgi:hypothetical protein
LLRQTFSGSHTVNSGNVTFNLTVNPSGSRTLNGPIMLTFGGPFQNRGHGQPPESNFNVSISALGKSGSLGILSTGTNGYVTLQGTSYQMPASTFQSLESGFARVSPGSASGALGRLGIHPLTWLQSPKVLGDENVAGTATTHIRAGVNVDALLGALNTLLHNAPSLGIPGASRLTPGLSPTTRSRIAGAVRNPSVDVWTGKGDKTLRRLLIRLTLPVTGQISTLLGGLRSADLGLTLQYANLNQAQSITAPTSVRPYSEFINKLRGFVQNLQAVSGAAGAGALGNTGTGTTGTGTTATGTGTTPAGSTGTSPTATSVQRYAQCVQAAAGNLSKMQSCAPLLSGGK